jgi:hypothetical protein
MPRLTVGALLTFTLVWYWTGYYGGVAAHRYFWRWILKIHESVTKIIVLRARLRVDYDTDTA